MHCLLVTLGLCQLATLRTTTHPLFLPAPPPLEIVKLFAHLQLSRGKLISLHHAKNKNKKKIAQKVEKRKSQK